MVYYGEGARMHNAEEEVCILSLYSSVSITVYRTKREGGGFGLSSDKISLSSTSKSNEARLSLLHLPLLGRGSLAESDEGGLALLRRVVGGGLLLEERCAEGKVGGGDRLAQDGQLL